MRSQSRKSLPKLFLIATEWTFVNYPTPDKPWGPQKKFQEIRKAGFAGIQTWPGGGLGQLAREAGLKLVAGMDVESIKTAEEKLRKLKEFGVVHVNVQLCNHDTPTKDALPIAIDVMKLGDHLGMKPAIEVHRDTCTETPEKAYALADAYQKRTGRKLRMNFDHSHPAVIKHLHHNSYVWKDKQVLAMEIKKIWNRQIRNWKG